MKVESTGLNWKNVLCKPLRGSPLNLFLLPTWAMICAFAGWLSLDIYTVITFSGFIIKVKNSFINENSRRHYKVYLEWNDKNNHKCLCISVFKSLVYTNKTVICYFVFSKIFFFFRYRQLLFCRVTLGKSFLQFSAMKMAHSPPGHHSVTGRPSVNGLALAEYVIYRGEQVNHFYLFIFKNTLELYFFLFLLISTRYIFLRSGFLFNFFLK